MSKWEKVRLGNVIDDIKDGGTPSRNNPDFFGGNINWVVIDDIKDEIWKTREQLTELGFRNCSSNLWKIGSVILSTGATIGEVGIAKIPCATKQGICGIEVKSDYIIPVFLKYYFQNQKPILQNLSQGSTIKEIRPKAINELEIFLPPLPIQTRIAEILSTADKTIEESEKLIAKYKRMKTGMMQDLLTKGIDENGNIRSEATHKFKDSPLGRIPVEWEVKRLGENDIFNIETGGTPSTMIKKFWTNGTIPWLSSGEIHKKVIFKTDNYITELGYKCSNTKYYPINSIIVALAGQGKTRGTVAITEIELTSNQSIAAIIVNLNSVEPYYLYYYLDLMYLDLRSISAGSGRAGLTKSILSDYLIKLPLKKEEQSRIANKLKEIDISIEIETETLSKLKRLKTGLMNDLLSGKVEVVDSG